MNADQKKKQIEKIEVRLKKEMPRILREIAVYIKSPKGRDFDKKSLNLPLNLHLAKPKLWIIAGCNGAGKSSYSKALVENNIFSMTICLVSNRNKREWKN